MTKNDDQRLLCRFDIARIYLPSALRPASPEFCMQCPWWFFKFNDGCQLSLLDLHPGISPEEVVEDVQVRAVLGPDDLRVVADHPAKKLMDFEHGVRHGSILHPPVAVPPPPFGLLCDVACFIAWPLPGLLGVFWSQLGGVWSQLGPQNQLGGLQSQLWGPQQQLEPAGRASKQSGRAFKQSGRAIDLARRVSQFAERVLEPTGRALEPAGGAQEQAGGGTENKTKMKKRKRRKFPYVVEP